MFYQASSYIYIHRMACWYEMKNLDRKIWVRFTAEAVKLESVCSLESSDTKTHAHGPACNIRG